MPALYVTNGGVEALRDGADDAGMSGEGEQQLVSLKCRQRDGGPSHIIVMNMIWAFPESKGSEGVE